MRVTSKGQVTIPERIRHKLGIEAGSEVIFIEKGQQVFIELVEHEPPISNLRQIVGSTTLKLSTDEIMNLTRLDHSE